MGNLKPGATYIYERADGITYAREFGSTDRTAIGWDYNVKLKLDQLKEDKLWDEIRQAAKKIVEWISINGFVPADSQIGDTLVDIQVVSPTIVRLHPAYHNKIGELSLTGNPDLL
jgi:hypothetical protein